MARLPREVWEAPKSIIRRRVRGVILRATLTASNAWTEPCARSPPAAAVMVAGRSAPRTTLKCAISPSAVTWEPSIAAAILAPRMDTNCDPANRVRRHSLPHSLPVGYFQYATLRFRRYSLPHSLPSRRPSITSFALTLASDCRWSGSASNRGHRRHTQYWTCPALSTNCSGLVTVALFRMRTTHNTRRWTCASISAATFSKFLRQVRKVKIMTRIGNFSLTTALTRRLWT